MKKLFKIGGVIIVVLVLVGGTGYLARHELTRIQEDLPAFSHAAGESREVMVKMSDGVTLYTTIAFPENNVTERSYEQEMGSFPTVLVRNPYAQFGAIMRDTLCGRFVRYGYACVFQDVRGQGESGGQWVPGENEVSDGNDTLDWLINQPFQNSNIAMVGPSYLAAVQWAAASGGLPEEVKTFIPAVYTTDNRAVMFHDGMFRHETFTAWASMMKTTNSSDDDAGKLYQQAIRYRPHIDVDTKVFGMDMPWYRRMVSGASADAEQWQVPGNEEVRRVPEELSVPILMIGGWYDVFFGPQYKDWQRLATQSKSRFIIGPWTHIGSGGEALETPNSDGGLFQWPIMLDWLDHHLKGEKLVNKPGVSTYAMRDNIWIERDSWPPKTETMRFYLSDPGNANRCEGGDLHHSKGDPSTSIDYQYNPDDPVPTKGGAGMLAFILPGFDGAKPANVLQNGLCEREDVLTFTTEPLAEDLKIVGDIGLRLSVSSDAEDTAFTGKLIEIFADGKMINIRDSITSLAYRNNAELPQSYTPGEKVDLDFEFWPIEWSLKKGSRLRLDISSSDFPKFHAHPNKVGNWAEIAEVKIATQTLFTGLGTESYLELSVAQ